MVYTAFSLVPLLDGLPVKPEAICAHGAYVYVGTADGLVYSYRTGQTGSVWIASLEVKKTICPKKIEQMAVLPKERQILILADGTIYVHSLATLEPINVLTSCKGASAFCICTTGPPYRLAAVVKKRIIVLEYFSNDWVYNKEILVPDTPLALSWTGNTISVAYRKEYSIILYDTGDSKIVFSITADVYPYTRPMTDEETIVVMDAAAQCMDMNGDASRSTIKFPSAPGSLAFAYPYLLGQMTKTVEIRNIDNENLQQTIAVDKLVSICDFGDRILVAAQTKLYLLVPTPLEDQISNLIAVKRVNEALALFDAVGNIRITEPTAREKQRAYIHEQAGYVLFADTNFTGALQHFDVSELDPRELLNFYPELSYKAASPYQSKNIYAGKTIEEMIKRSLEGKTGFGSVEKAQLATRLLTKSKKELTPFLLNIRKRLAPESLPAVDTALVKLCASLDMKDELQNLLRRRHYAELEDSIAALKSYGNQFAYAEGLLYASRNMTKEALEVWEQLGRTADNDSSAAALNSTIETLCQQDDSDLLWTYSPWALAKAPEDAIEIFTAGLRSQPLDHNKVLDFLGKQRSGNLLLEQYLEHIVLQEGNPSEQYSTMLANMYLDTVLTLFPAQSNSQQRKTPGSEPGLLGKTRARLFRLLSQVDTYDTIALLQRLEPSNLYEECVLIYGKANLHSQALHCLAFKLADHAAAEQYCLEHAESVQDSPSRSTYASTGSGPLMELASASTKYNSLFCELVNIYLHPPTGTPMRKQAMDVLRRHARFIDAGKVLPLLPRDVTVSDVSAYMQQVICSRVHAARTSTALMSVMRAHTHDSREKLMEEKRRSLLILHETTCPQCQKRISDQPFSLYPNGTIVHLKCVSKMSQPQIAEMMKKGFL